MPLIRDDDEERRARIEQMIESAQALHDAAVRRIEDAQRTLSESEAMLARLKKSLKPAARARTRRKRS